MTDVTLILPAFNEAASIEETIKQAIRYFESRRLSFQLIVAADGMDGTRELVRELGKADSRLFVIGHSERRGKGRGVREAVQLANGKVIGFADADNKVPLDELDKILPLFEKGSSVVIGSRALRTSCIERKPPFHRRIGSRIFTVGAHAIVGSLAADTQCGFKFFTHEAAKRIFALQRIDGYMFDIEVLSLAKAFDYPVSEIAVRWRDDRDTRLDLFRGNVQNIIDLLRIRFSMSTVTASKSKAFSATAGGADGIVQ
jgi:glycosyltransferase involved in cell wall biosynthesis